MMGLSERLALRREPHCCYRFFDDDGVLLYVGMTRTLERRKAQHRSKPWWPDVAACVEEWHPTFISARNAERVAIVREDPRHNVPVTESIRRTLATKRRTRSAA